MVTRLITNIALFEFKNNSSYVIILNERLHGRTRIELQDKKTEIWFNRGILHRKNNPAFFRKIGRDEMSAYVEDGYLKDLTVYGDPPIDPSLNRYVSNRTLNKIKEKIPCSASMFILGITREVFTHKFYEDEFDLLN